MTLVDDGLSRIFAALADPTRRDMLTRLKAGPLTVGELAAPYEMSRPAVSQHLKVLESAGLITRTADAQWRQCHLREEGFAGASAWIARHSTEWSERFDLLAQHLRSASGPEPAATREDETP